MTVSWNFACKNCLPEYANLWAVTDLTIIKKCKKNVTKLLAAKLSYSLKYVSGSWVNAVL